MAPEDHLTPFYPATEGVTQGRLRMLVRMALEQGLKRTARSPARRRSSPTIKLPSLRDALHYVHRPPTDAPVEELDRRPATRRSERLAFEELLLAHQLSLKLLRQSHPERSRLAA